MNKQKILELACEFVKRTGQLPTRNDITRMGVTRDAYRTHYGTVEALHNDLKNKFDIIDVRDLKNSKIPKNKKVFVITTVITGAKVDTNFLASIDNYCKIHNAELLLIPAMDTNQKVSIDPILKGRRFITEDTKLNENCGIIGIGIRPKTVDSTSGLNRIGRRNGTFIVAGTKRTLKYVATTNKKLPHALMSTGALTLPNYGSFTLMNKQNYIAHNDHTMGAVIVELDKNNYFHFRQITADSSGKFIDLGIEYSKNKTRKVKANLVLGDLHIGKTCPIVRKATLELSDKLNIKKWIIHDAFDAYTISHHDIGKQATLAIKANKGMLSLRKELDDYVNELVFLSKKRQLIIVKSNHDEHLERYLSEARYIKHPHNHQLGLQLANALIEENNPLEWYTKSKVGNINVMWLKRDEDYIIGGVQLGAHGDKGPNGSQASITSMEASYGDVVYGHAHTPQIMRGAFCVGTSTPTKPDYGDGPSSWMNTHCLVYENGQRQLINLIEGKFTTLL
jgi:nucleoid DNA-binding protein